MTTKLALPPLHSDAPRVDREDVRAVMRNAGILVEASPATVASATQSTLTLDEAAAILSRGDGPAFSQQVDEERGPKG
jgi:hypothetical protein